MGLFRLWCIPEGASPAEGAYLRYDHEAMVSILLLEAAARRRVRRRRGPRRRRAVRARLPRRPRRARHLDPVVRDRRRRDRGRPRPGASCAWPRVTTHDLPPTAGYLAGEHVRLRDSLGLLTRSVEEELAVTAQEQRDLPRRAPRPRAARRRRRRRRRSSPRCTRCSPAPRAGCSASRWPTWSATGVPRTSPAPTASTPTGGSRSPAPTAHRCCSRTCRRLPRARAALAGHGCVADAGHRLAPWPCGSWRAARTRRS